MRTEEDTIEAGHCYLTHRFDDDAVEFVEFDDDGNMTYRCSECGDEWTEYV